MALTAIAAVGLDGELGKDGKLLWHLASDLKRFRSLTHGHVIIMGRKTLETFKSPLPRRTHVVITRRASYKPSLEGVIVTTGIEQALEYAQKDSQPFVIGGGEIYGLAMPYIEKLELTLVQAKFPDADAFFPKINPEHWELLCSEKQAKDEKNEYECTYNTYAKKG